MDAASYIKGQGQGTEPMSQAFARLASNRVHGEACVPRAVLLSSGAVETLDERTGGWTSMTGR